MFYKIFIAIIFICLITSVHAQVPPVLINSGEILKKGIDYHDNGDYEKALEMYSQISRNDTNYYTTLYEMALSYQALKDYESAIKICKLGLEQENMTLRSEFINLLGSSYDDNKQPDEAIAILQLGVKEFPGSYLLKYNLGSTYYRKNDFSNAEKYLIEALIINPFHFRSNYYLALTNVKMGRLVEAIMAFNMATLVGDNKLSFYALQDFENFIGKKMDKEMQPEKYPRPDGQNEIIEIEKLIKSKIALNSKYKYDSKLNSDVVKQTHLVFSHLSDKINWQHLYYKFYSDLFMGIMKQKMFPEYSIFLLRSIDNEKINGLIKKNDAKIKKMADYINSFVENKRKYAFDKDLEALKKMTYTFYNRGNLSGYITYADATQKVKNGPVVEYFNTGVLEFTSTYKNNEYDGNAKLYHPNGKLKADVNFVMGKPDGEWRYYWDNGELKAFVIYKNGKKNGPYKNYNSSGVVTEEGNYVDDKINGEVKYYFDNGNIKSVFAYKDDKPSGPATEYYLTGQLFKKGNFVNNELDGEFLSYYPNGQLKQKFNYKAGKEIGEYIEYFENGQVQSTGRYNDKNKEVGIWKSYYSDGKPRDEYNYSENGKRNGFAVAYNVDGKLIGKYNYLDGTITSVIFYDTLGKEIANYKDLNGKKEVAVKWYYPDGTYSVGNYKNGNWHGKVLSYSMHNVLLKESYYQNGKLEGKQTEYYCNGKPQNELTWKNDEQNGLYTEWYADGKVKIQGWYVKGQRQGDWYSYNPNGQFESKQYFLNDFAEGYQVYFEPDEKINTEQLFSHTNLIKILRYDSTGNIFETILLKNGNGDCIYKNPNGSLAVTCKYIGGVRNDTLRVFTPNGVVQREFFILNGYRYGTARVKDIITLKTIGEYPFFHDKLHGVYKSYDFNGNPDYKANYYQGNRVDTAYWYHDNGKIETMATYKDNKRHGYTYYYSYDGQLQVRLKYYMGEIISYSYLGKDKKYVAEIPVLNGTGIIKAYFPNGKLSAEIEFKNGKFAGTRTFYYFDGTKMEETNFLNGEFHGKLTKYYPNGKIRENAQYVYDELHGDRFFYNEKGQRIRSEQYYYGNSCGNWYEYKNDKPIKKYVFWGGDAIEMQEL